MSELKVTEHKSFREVIRERRSVRSYDPTFKLSREEIKALLEEATLAPSSNNLQPWRFLVIDEQQLKEKLLPIAYNQKQVVDSAAVIALFGDVEAYKQADAIFTHTVNKGFMRPEAKDSYVQGLIKNYGSMPREKAERIVYIDGGLIAMQLMLAARARGLDTVPMGGYDAAKLIEAFDVPANYTPVMLIALGKAAEPGRPTVRLTVDEVTHWNTF